MLTAEVFKKKKKMIILSTFKYQTLKSHALQNIKACLKHHYYYDFLI